MVVDVGVDISVGHQSTAATINYAQFAHSSFYSDSDDDDDSMKAVMRN